MKIISIEESKVVNAGVAVNPGNLTAAIAPPVLGAIALALSTIVNKDDIDLNTSLLHALIGAAIGVYAAAIVRLITDENTG